MSGLILAGIGKGIADAGQTFGSAMMRDYEFKRQEELAALREERAVAREDKREEARDERAVAREIRAEDRKEAAALKDANIYAQAEESATGVGEARRFEKFKKDLGQTDATDEELRKVFDEQYDQRKVGNFEGADRYTERYSKQKEDVLNEIRRMGGSSGLINQAQASVKATQEAERAADRLAFDERKDMRLALANEKKLEALMGYRDRMAGAAETRAGAAVIAANRPPASGRSGTVAGMSEVKLNQEAETLRKAAKDASSMDARRDYEARLKEVMDEIQARRKAGNSAKPKTGDNSGARPPLSSFAR